VITPSELPRCADGLLWDTPSIGPLQPALVARKPLHQKIGEDFDPLRSWSPRRRYPIHSAGWERPIARKSHYKLDQAAPIAKVEDLADYDAIVVGAGTRFGRLSSQMANFLDQAGGLWARGAFHGKVGGAFTSTATQHGGQETTLFSIITNLLHFGMVIVGLDYGHAGQMTLDEITGGSPYGATTIAGGDGSRQPTANELQGARYQGRKIAETAKKLHG
jgi:NAD(P)H dehydrogenase (quinone)